MKTSTRTTWIATALVFAAIASPVAQAADLPAGQPYPSGAAVLSLSGTGSLGEAPPIRSTYPSGYALVPKGSAETIVTTGPKGFDFTVPAHWQSEAAAPVQLVGEDGFDFRDAGIGGAVGLAAALLLAGATLAMRRHRDLAHN
jgi:hypothetical protein